VSPARRAGPLTASPLAREPCTHGSRARDAGSRGVGPAAVSDHRRVREGLADGEREASLAVSREGSRGPSRRQRAGRRNAEALHRHNAETPRLAPTVRS